MALPGKTDIPLFELSSNHCAFYSAYLAMKYNGLATGSFCESDLLDHSGLVSMDTLVACMNARGLSVLAVQCELKDLENYPGGFIMVLKATDQKVPRGAFHYCFGFYKAKQKQFYLADPVLSSSVVKFNPDTLAGNWTGYAIVIGRSSG